jgi:hypothetical protein
MSRLMFRLIIHIFILIEVVKGMYVNVTTFSAYGGSHASDNFGQFVSLAMQGDTLIAASFVMTGYGGVVELFKSIDIGQTWIYIQSLSYETFSNNDIQFFLSETGNEILLDTTALYVCLDDVYIRSGQSFAISDDECQPQHPPTITSAALSGNGRYVNIAWNCVGYDYDLYSYLYIFDIISETVVVSVDLHDADGAPVIPSLMVSNYDASLIVLYPTCIVKIIESTGSLIFGIPYGDDISLTSDGSLVAVGSCGKNVVIYNVTNQTISQTISSPDMTNAYFGCNVDLSSDGIRLVVGSNIKQSNGYAYAYIQVGGLFILETRLNPPLFNLSYGSGGVAVINTLQNQGIVLVGGPQAGIGSSSPSGLIAVYKSVIASVTATPTATSTSSSSSTTTPTSTSSASASATATSSATSSSTSTFSSTSTSSSTISPTISTLPGPQSSALAAHAYVFEVTFGIALSGGIVGSMIGCFLYKWIKQRKEKEESQTVSVESINSVNSAGISLLYSS